MMRIPSLIKRDVIERPKTWTFCVVRRVLIFSLSGRRGEEVRYRSREEKEYREDRDRDREILPFESTKLIDTSLCAGYRWTPKSKLVSRPKVEGALGRV